MKYLYWVITLLFLLPTAGSGIFEVLGNPPADVVHTMQVLGYPLYITRILGFFKLLGALAILVERSKMLKEWAYAGYAFMFMGATASHLFAADYAHAPFPFVFLLIEMGSYVLWHRAQKK